MNGLFDTHCHLMSPVFVEEDLNNILEEAKLIGVNLILNVGYDYETSKLAIDQSMLSTSIFAAIGIHPNDIHKENDDVLEKLETLIQTGNVSAIGEIGLDYYRSNDTKQIQKEWLKKQIILAKKYNLPILLHIRDAFDDAYEIVKEQDINKGILHSYTGDLQTALKFIKLGFYISFSGIITFENAKDLQEVVKKIPLNNVVLETDSPYLTPHPFRGTRNYPKNIIFTAKKLAVLKQVPLNEVIKTTTNNAKKVLLIE